MFRQGGFYRAHFCDCVSAETWFPTIFVHSVAPISISAGMWHVKWKMNYVISMPLAYFHEINDVKLIKYGYKQFHKERKAMLKILRMRPRMDHENFCGSKSKLECIHVLTIFKFNPNLWELLKMTLYTYKHLWKPTIWLTLILTQIQRV